ncbi:MAG: FCD domain-containing protein, partial [Actinomycetota bacterium]
FAARRACERRTSADLVALEESIVRLDAFDVTTASVVDIWRENVAFHIAVAEAAHTLKLVEFLRSLFDLPAVYHPIFAYTEENKALFVSWHRRIAAAISARDSEGAAQLTRDHVLEARGLALASAVRSAGIRN